MKTIFLTSLFFLVCSFTFAQAPDTLWTKRIGGSDYDYGKSVQQTFDGGYILTGTVRLGQDLSGDVGLIKTDSLGNTLWVKTYGDSVSFDWGGSVKQTADSGYIITGFWGNTGDLYLLKTDNYGDTTWTKIYGSEYLDEGYSIDQTFDGGYIISGSRAENYIWLIKTDQNGDTSWCKDLGYGKGYSVQQTSDSGYIVLGGSWYVGYIKLIKTNFSGDTIWAKSYGNYNSNIGYNVQQTDDGGYIIVGETSINNYSDILVIKTNSLGDTLWTRTFGDVGNDQGFSIKQTSDGGYILTGCIEYGGGTLTRDVWVIKIDSLGNFLWDKTISEIYDDTGYDIQKTSDGGFIIVGQVSGNGCDIWLIKLASGVLDVDNNINLVPEDFTLSQNYPNPFNPSTKISWQSPVGIWQTIKIYDVLGNEVATLVDEYKPAGKYEVEFNSLTGIRDLASGIYFYQLLVSALQSKDGRAENYIETKKMILLK
jgi:hypothetical protein